MDFAAGAAVLLFLFYFSIFCGNNQGGTVIYEWVRRLILHNKERRVDGGEVRKLSGFSKFWIVSWLGGDAVAF